MSELALRFQIGQQVWCSTFESSATYITCPDCGGDGRVRVILANNEIVSVECEGCRQGFHPSTGRVQVYDRKPEARLVTITGVEIHDGKTEWQTSYSYRTAEDRLFNDEAAAMRAAEALAAQHDREERERVNQKEKPLKSWSWHAHYHRRCIRDAQRQIEYHQSKLAVARVKAKEPEPVEQTP